MELDFVTSNLLDDDAVEVGSNVTDFAGIEGERCGICMDIIIDRGVLDCCQHWFCFECIDNWSTIMNLCPLCQSEFQLITCVPVYDIGGSGKDGEDSSSRDEDWCVEGKTDAFSSPSHYINENAVICLDGLGCKIRQDPSCIEGDSSLDTSIACDSCDIWYHAFCVGFDPESASDDTWICPRCLSNEKPQESDAATMEAGKSEYFPEKSNSGCSGEAVFSGSFSVAVADEGETAIVVSIVKGNEWHMEPSETTPSLAQAKMDGCPDNSHLETCSMNDIKEQVPGKQELKLSLSHEISSGLPSDSMPQLFGEHLENGTGILIEQGKLFCATINSSDISNIISAKRKHSDCGGNDDDTETKTEIVEKLKRSKPGEKEKEETMSMDHENISTSNDATVDILDIVKGTSHKPLKRSLHPNLIDKVSEGENVAGLRVKKIMRTTADEKESSVLVEKLRKQIREAVRNKSANDIGENLFDPKLLAAFRAAIAGPKTEEPPKTLSPVAVKAKKLMLQKGKVRENLTKKIYADSNGKRRSAWHRDCEVEFWKHRCIRTRKPEKIETLKSVLSLLRKNPVDTDKNLSSKNLHQASNPILSRLYLADTSVFPRKDDIKPLLTLKETGSSHNNAKATETDKILPNVSAAKGTNSHTVGSKGSDKSHPNKRSDGTSNSASSNSKETSGKSDDLKKDKRKWALEVLARKKSLSLDNSSQDKEGDTVMLKGNYPLLAQLPVDMRPDLATSRHNKVPVSVRQIQLYRLTEHFLKKANLPVIRRTAATELAIADAINVEKAIADKSSSKVVYLNLCSQEILHHSESKVLDKTADQSSLSSPADDESNQTTDKTSDDQAVLQALRTAGLVSDSPPNSPVCSAEVLPDKAGNSLDKSREEDHPDNVLDIDVNPEVDIYGDFEYDLDDEDFMGVTTAAKALETQPEEDLTKVKVVLNSLKPEKPAVDPDVSEDENTRAIQNATEDGGIKPVDVEEEGGETFSLAECQELYGPDKEPVVVEENNLPSVKALDSECESNVHKEFIGSNFENSNMEEEKSSSRRVQKRKQKEQKDNTNTEDGSTSSVTKKVEAYIKEHIRPLCKSGVINVDQYRWAVTKATEKVMKYHTDAKSANFLIKEGEKVKKLAEQYVEAAATSSSQRKEK
ncbi:PREDICTED: uncharacterized protein At4g10930 [Tarenaya hassleriana]|uniref:uncharacterized protein At4g10930 n=1 Tax=Tarenaya hassleriana TaxID=28532 RepID=UPI0008FD63B2|nr:PREDICTED: uncharacterized protein At4g10930 [Tarenaya hassleriana]